jgi:spore maturation protein CgeB
LVNGKHALVSDTMQELAEKTAYLLTHPDKAKEIGEMGRKFVQKHYDWKAIVRLHDDIYKKAINKSQK